MALPTYDGFSLQDDNYITTEIEHRTIPKRNVVTRSIARKPGSKLISTEFGERQIKMVGFILGSDGTDLITRIDNFHSNVTRKEIGTLIVDGNREITAVVTATAVGDPHYAQDMVPMQVEFLAAEPFFKGPQHTASFTVTSGSLSQSETVSVSGSVFAEPTITYNAPSGSGTTTTSGVIVEYTPQAETITWSGSGLAYSDMVQFDYQNEILTEGTTERAATGVYSRWEPGSTDFTVTFSGSAQGGTIDFVYRPRYL